MKLIAFLVVAAGCSKPAVKGEFSQFIAPIGQMRAAGCTDDTDGKRFWLEGWLQLPQTVTVSDKKATLNFYAELDAEGNGVGRALDVQVETPGDVDDLVAAAEGRKSNAFGRGGKLGADALKVRAKNGRAGERDRIRLTIELEAMRDFRTKAITTCVHHFKEAEKL
jgi:hypothetical protein